MITSVFHNTAVLRALLTSHKVCFRYIKAHTLTHEYGKVFPIKQKYPPGSMFISTSIQEDTNQVSNSHKTFRLSRVLFTPLSSVSHTIFLSPRFLWHYKNYRHASIPLYGMPSPYKYTLYFLWPLHPHTKTW